MNRESEKQVNLRSVPAVQRVMEEASIKEASASLGRGFLVTAVRETLGAFRARLRAGHVDEAASVTPARLADEAVVWARRRAAGGIRRVINATGVILHTGLGRAVLSEAALRSIAEELGGYASVELELESGKRGKRDSAVAELLKVILGCESAIVVNNNAAATMLALAALGRGKEVVVSRGQLVEIGGSFRVPDVMAQSGARMVEVGTTNRTHLRDYENAITAETGVLLVVHTSNYRVQGFTAEAPMEALVALARKRNLLVVYDIGSGALAPEMAAYLQDEPIVKHAVDAGVDVITFSGDKILGGPQSGLAVGRKQAIQTLRGHPLYRAFRCDKLILRALESTLAVYLDLERRWQELPTLRMLGIPFERLKQEAEGLARRLCALNLPLHVDTLEDTSRLGSGSLPQGRLPTVVVRMRPSKIGAEALCARLRAHRPPVIARIQDDGVLIDPRTLQAGEADDIVRALQAILG